MAMQAHTINKFIRDGKIVTANVPGRGEVRIIMTRTDMMGRIAVQVERKGSFFNVEPASVRISEPDAVSN